MDKFRIVGLDQRSNEWVEWRKQGIGASDIPILMGTNLYSTPHELWQKKCGFKEDPEPNFAMKQGAAIENKALKWVNTRLELNLRPLCIMDRDRPEFRASLDGYDIHREVVCEIKCPISSGIQKAAHLYHQVPEYWLDQLQWQAFLTKCKRAFLAVWNVKKSACTIIDVLPSKERQLQMITVASDFWQSIKFGKPPNLTSRDTIEFRDEALEDILEEYDFVTTQARETERTRRELREQIVPFLNNGRKFKIGRFKITKTPLGKRYNIKQMELDGIDIQKYVIPSEKESFALRVSCKED